MVPGEYYLSAEKDAMAAETSDAANNAPAGIRMDGGSKL